MNYNFFRKRYFSNHRKANWLVYFIMSIFILYLFLDVIYEFTYKGSQIIEGVILSYISAYIFYLVLNVYVDYKKEKNSLTIKEGNLSSIARDINAVWAIIKCFSNSNFTTIKIPNKEVYLKYNNGKTFFNPREEIRMNINSIKNNINEMSKKYFFELSYELNYSLNNIEKCIDELNEKLKVYYDCFDKNYSFDKIGIRDLSECLDELYKECHLISCYVSINLKKYEYQELTPKEKNKYQQEIQDILLSKRIIKQVGFKGRIYQGGTRIL